MGIEDTAGRPGDEEVLDLTDVADGGEGGEGEGSDDDQQDDEAGEDEQASSDELVISLDGEEVAPEPDNPTIRQMREALRKKDAELAEMRKASQPKPIEVGPKPTLEGCDYDEERFEAELTAWHADKAKADEASAKQREEQEAIRATWDEASNRYKARAAEIAAPDFDDAQETIDKALTPRLSPVILKAARDPAVFVLAMHRNPAKLAELAKATDAIELAAAVARMEAGIKVNKRTAPAPDRPLNGSTGAATATTYEKQLAKLEAEAEKTGDRTKVVAFKREARNKK